MHRMDYKKTLNITLGDKDPGAMPMRGSLPTREPEILARWDAIGLYQRSLEKPEGAPTFILHDGPPYSNGDIHLGHALNKIAKDIIVKYKSMQGCVAPYVPGWDNHGMPIENEVSKEFRSRGEKPDKVTLRQRCRSYAADFVERQKRQFKRLGVRGDWDNPYLTMSSAFEAKIVATFGELAQKGYIYRGLKPVQWCGVCETALADAEVEYSEHTSNSIFVKFAVEHDPQGVVPQNSLPSYVIIWTTTPWTIPANLALAVHPDAEYHWVQVNGENWLAAVPLVKRTVEAAGFSEWTDETLVRGSQLEGLVTRHPLYARTSPVVLADYVTMEDGTGIVHTAPGHGKEDFETGRRYGLQVLCPVDASATLTIQAGAQFAGRQILGSGDANADAAVIAALKDAGALLNHTPFQHSYPHCWRCHSPLIFRATVQWFMNIDHEGHRQKSLAAIEAVRWYPPVSKNRIAGMVSGRPDWCLSRQRAWGVGIPAFYCKACGAEDLSADAVQSVVQHVARESSDVWYARSASELLPAGHRCVHCGGTEFDKETDILDVWFDSGSTHLAVLESGIWPEQRWPADIYLEGSDQHRGWFNSSLMVGVGARGRAPYNAVITNGWTLDETGRAMHKSWGNAVSPNETVEKLGADILRLWVGSTDYFEDVRCGENVLNAAGESYRRIRNTLRFLVNNLSDHPFEDHRFDPGCDAVPADRMQELDRWVLARLDSVVADAAAGYDAFEFHRVFHAVHNFCVVDLSAFYLDVIKDRLYCSRFDSPERRSAQTALYTLAHTLVRLLTPVLSFTCEEVWGYLHREGMEESPQLASFPSPDPSAHGDILERWRPLVELRETVNQAVEAARNARHIANAQEAGVQIGLSAEKAARLAPFADILPVVLKVSQAEVLPGTEGIQVARAAGAKCARCWIVKTDTHPDTELCSRCAAVVSSL
jgi:isoleucyl-tRNA synthetase